jgi:hypothetical protein
MTDTAKNNPLSEAAGQKEQKSWYSGYYDSGMRYIEDTYLKWFGENRTSYGVKGRLSNPT